MKLVVFQSDKGDCLMVEDGNGRARMLVDGGMAHSYEKHVAPYLERALTRKHIPLDIVYVSHVDEDHIAGVLKMMDDLVDWRVFDHQKKTGNPKAKPPQHPRPPEAKEIWHNAFREQVGKNAEEIANRLATTANILSNSEVPGLRGLATSLQNLALSNDQAIRLSRRVSPEQLNIRLNPEFAGKLMQVQNPQPRLKLGAVRVTVLGPFAKDLEKLRKEWNQWLQGHKKNLASIQKAAARDQDRLTNDLERLLVPLASQRQMLEQSLADALPTAAAKLGDRARVTTPNLASLMVLLEEGNQTVLLTGDGHWEDIIAGLKCHGYLQDDKSCKLDILKVQHHGSEYNICEEFCAQVFADQYIFCGNGAHSNPDLRVVRLIAESRLKQFPGTFKFWFNSHSSVSEKAENAAHIKKVETLVQELARKSNGRMQFEFLKKSFFEIN